jgi:hypothetical protein
MKQPIVYTTHLTSDSSTSGPEAVSSGAMDLPHENSLQATEASSSGPSILAFPSPGTFQNHKITNQD